MAYVDWKAEYSVNVPSIDMEHQKLFSMLNELHDAMRVGKGMAVAPSILNRLVEYAQKHFANEEKLMMRAGYEDYASHKAEHKKLTDDVVKMMQNFEAKKSVLTLDLLKFLDQWLKQHILSCDKKYSSKLRAAGVQ
jgi:hemerythrin-like metal-binding protein